MKTCVIIPAAGFGKRMQNDINKQFIMLEEMPILAHTINAFESSPLIDEIIVVCAKNEIEICKREILEKYGFSKVVDVVAGGETRQESVYNGLKHLNEDIENVLIHDGARPFISDEIIQRIIDCMETEAAVIVGVKEKNTIKKVVDGYVEETIPRENVWEIQTPQAFKKKLILDSYENNYAELGYFTDDSSIAEASGNRIKIVEGDYFNIKITTPEDLVLGKAILEMRK